jgi:hypothetical protein
MQRRGGKDGDILHSDGEVILFFDDAESGAR